MGAQHLEATHPCGLVHWLRRRLDLPLHRSFHAAAASLTGGSTR